MLTVSNSATSQLQHDLSALRWVLNRCLKYRLSSRCQITKMLVILQRTEMYKEMYKVLKHSCWAIALSFTAFVLPRPRCRRCRGYLCNKPMRTRKISKWIMLNWKIVDKLIYDWSWFCDLLFVRESAWFFVLIQNRGGEFWTNHSTVSSKNP